ncbi:MAG: phosphodiester glycosidase family protein, partial [Prosthecobacter sp.]
PAFKEWSGSFFVKGGRPYFGPKSLLDEVPGLIEEATQGYPSVMKNHTIFSYVDLKPDTYFDGSKITYRSLAGMRKDGTIVFILSGDGGVMNVSEAAELARKLDLQHATLLDGGRALQYSLMTEDGPWHFTALNTRLNFEHRWLEPQRSPVYIGVRRRAPQIISVGQAP